MTRHEALELLRSLSKQLEEDMWGDIPTEVTYDLANDIPEDEWEEDTVAFVSAAERAWK